MPIRREHRFFYPIDWPQLSAVIRFGRAQGRCEGCGRPHGRLVYYLGDGRWRDADAGRWRDDRGRPTRVAIDADVHGRVRTTRVFLAAAHRNHNTSDNADATDLVERAVRETSIRDWVRTVQRFRAEDRLHHAQ